MWARLFLDINTEIFWVAEHFPYNMADANSHNKHHYPQYKKGDNYELFKTKLNYWAKITSLAKEKQGLAIALYSLPENDESMIYEK